MAGELGSQTLYYDPGLTYQDNLTHGPFGDFADGERFKTQGEPQKQFLGVPVHLDMGISAGPLVNGRAVKAALDHGWDVATYKTVRSEFRPVNGFPNLLPTTLAQMYNSEIASHGITTGKSFSFPGSPTNSYGVP